MIWKTLLGLVALLVLAVLGLWFLSTGPFAEPWASSPVVAGPRPADVQARPAVLAQPHTTTPAGSDREILFGDLHVHTSFSSDAALFGLSLGSDVVMPSDACDFARYCSALDFWSINDHAEGMTPRTWADSTAAIRDCNAQAGDPARPDMVSFLGWEWSQGRAGNKTHYGHKNVVLREWEEGRVPLRPIASEEVYLIVQMIPGPLRATVSLGAGFETSQAFSQYFAESAAVPTCDYAVRSDQLPADCREVAATPTDLYRKLDELGYDAVVIPHGLAWGRTNPRDGDFAGQMAEHNADYQTLIETYSGHGNSEVFADFQRRVAEADGSYSCPPASENFVPCCQRAGELIRARCEDPDSQACAATVEQAKRYATEVIDDRARGVVPGASLEEWGNCGQLLDSFLPSWYYVPRQSTQYALALGDFSQGGAPRRARFGIMASSDGHKGRPGTGYKQFDRVYMTDTKDVGDAGGSGIASRLTGLLQGTRVDGEVSTEPVQVSEQSFLAGVGRPNRMGSFYYTGGLIGVHADSRNRDDLWAGVDTRQVYGTSGERMLLWFDLLNGAEGELPMGSEVALAENPRFRVRALGAFHQQPGCPEYSHRALGDERLAKLCRGECYNPSDERKKITRIEVVRIRPQLSQEEAVDPLIEDVWRSFDCPADGSGCEVEFTDPDFVSGGRETLYYVRAIQAAQPTINGDNYRCDYDAQGNCTRINFCRGEQTPASETCLAMAEPRAWSSPIFIDHRR
jgi:hypothetical protein